ncbi:MAG: hypothetical protein R3C53_25755 [Pirellulaceae bacterium]
MTRLRIEERSKSISFDRSKSDSLLATGSEEAVEVTKRDDGKVDVRVRLAPLISCSVMLRALPKEPEEIVVGLDTVTTQYADGTVTKKLKVSLEPDGAAFDCCVECDGRIVCGPNACILCDNGILICCMG